jgi:penicillin-binding protein 1A
MALPIWALYMKKNYANKDLGVSTDAFEVPEEMSINVDCSKEAQQNEDDLDTEDDLDGLDF